MTYRQSPHNNESGFTIVEIAVSVVLFAIVAVTLVSTVEYVQYAQHEAVYVDVANKAAHTKISEYQNLGYTNVANGEESFSSDPNLSKLPNGHTAVAKVTQSTLAPGSKQVEITIKYAVGSTDKDVIMKAYINKRGAN